MGIERRDRPLRDVLAHPVLLDAGTLADLVRACDVAEEEFQQMVGAWKESNRHLAKARHLLQEWRAFATSPEAYASAGDGGATPAQAMAELSRRTTEFLESVEKG